MPRLVLKVGDQTKQIPIGDRPVSVGNAAGSTVQISDPALSKVHFQLVKSGNDYKLMDFSSSGTFINGIKVNKEKVVKHGDKIQAGQYQFQFLASTTGETGRMTKEQVSGQTTTSTKPIPADGNNSSTAQTGEQKKVTSRTGPIQSQTSRNVKPVTGRVQTQSTGKTGPIQTQTGTGKMKPVTSKLKPVTKRKKSLAQKKMSFAAEYEKTVKRQGNPIVIASVVGVLILGAGIYGWVAMSKEPENKAISKKLTKIREDIQMALRKNKYDEAIKLCEEGIKECEKLPKEFGGEKEGLLASKNDYSDRKVRYQEYQAIMGELKLTLDKIKEGGEPTNKEFNAKVGDQIDKIKHLDKPSKEYNDTEGQALLAECASAFQKYMDKVSGAEKRNCVMNPEFTDPIDKMKADQEYKKAIEEYDRLVADEEHKDVHMTSVTTGKNTLIGDLVPKLKAKKKEIEEKIAAGRKSDAEKIWKYIRDKWFYDKSEPVKAVLDDIAAMFK